MIRRLVRDLDLDLELVVMPTVREDDGLAHSSRNKYLGPEQRRAAPVIFRALRRAEALWRTGEGGGDKLRQAVRQVLDKEPLVDSIDYVSVADPDSLEELDQGFSGAMVSAALHLGKVRAHRQYHPRVTYWSNQRTAIKSASNAGRTTKTV